MRRHIDGDERFFPVMRKVYESIGPIVSRGLLDRGIVVVKDEGVTITPPVTVDTLQILADAIGVALHDSFSGFTVEGLPGAGVSFDEVELTQALLGGLQDPEFIINNELGELQVSFPRDSAMITEVVVPLDPKAAQAKSPDGKVFVRGCPRYYNLSVTEKVNLPPDISKNLH